MRITPIAAISSARGQRVHAPLAYEVALIIVRSLGVLGLCVALSCEDGLLYSPAIPSSASLSISTTVTQNERGSSEAFDRANEVSVRVRAGNQTRADTTVAFSPTGVVRVVRIGMPLRQAVETLSVDLELRETGRSIFRGSSSNFVMISGGVTRVEIPSLSPVIGGVTCAGTLVQLSSYGQAVRIQGAALFATGDTISNASLAWATSNGNVASVSQAGDVTAVGDGDTQISCMAGGFSATRAVRVFAVVSAVAVAPPAATIRALSTITLTPTIRDARGNVITTQRPVSWSTTNAAVARVDGAGVVTGVAPGIARIDATSGSVVGSGAVTVTQAAVATVSVTLANSVLFVGQSTQAVATPRDSLGNALIDKTVSGWSSGNIAIASVNSNGVVTAVGPGTATISAIIDGIAGTASLVVNRAPIVSLTVTLPPSLSVGQATQAISTALDANGNVVLPAPTFTWISSNSSVATVSTTGLVTAVAPGTATITATIGTISGSATAVVRSSPTARVQVALLPINCTPCQTNYVNVGQGISAVATALDANNTVVLPTPTVTWTSSNPSVATVTANGLVTGVAPGTVTITATIGAVSGFVSLLVYDAAQVFVRAVGGGSGGVTVSSSRLGPCPGPILPGQNCNMPVQLGDRIQALATPNTGSVIVWSGACSGSSPTCTFTITSGGIWYAVATFGPAPGTSAVTTEEPPPKRIR